MRPALTDLIDHLGPTPALVTADELRACVLLDNADVLVLNKPGWLVCHPSKNGPMSSLVGAVREVFGLDQVHLVSRLDRETSGLVLLAKHKAAARHLQMALQAGYVEKRYCAILHGALDQSRVEVSQALEPDPESPVAAQVRVAPRGGGQKAQSTFKRLDVAITPSRKSACTPGANTRSARMPPGWGTPWSATKSTAGIPPASSTSLKKAGPPRWPNGSLTRANSCMRPKWSSPPPTPASPTGSLQRLCRVIGRRSGRTLKG